MSLRAKASAVALAALAALLLAPAAMASSGPAQFTGRQLKAALLPASDFVAGYTAPVETDSGRHPEHSTLFNLRSVSCSTFWLFIGNESGFGETAFASDLVEDKTGTLTPEEIFDQSIYQFASTGAAASFFSQLTAKYRSCHSVATSSGGKTVRQTVHSETALRVGGHQASLIVDYVATGVPGPPLKVYLLWTIDGTDVYWISTTPITPGAPQPTQSSLTLELIARVSHLG
jgi:hypothetical protein